MTVPNPFGAGPPYRDYILLGGDRCPGKQVVPDANSPRKWDERQGYGFSGAYLIYMGDGLAHFGVEVHLWDDAHWAQWETFSKKHLEKPPTGQVAKAQPIDHPVLNMTPLKIASVVVEDVTGWVVDDYGEWTCLIKFAQFRKPKPALGRPIATIAPVKTPVPTAQDAGDIAFQAALKDFNEEWAK